MPDFPGGSPTCSLTFLHAHKPSFSEGLRSFDNMLNNHNQVDHNNMKEIQKMHVNIMNE